ncbi:MAG TPA: hypothetical protein VGC41_01380, partial [Kofleriaceae bacterium]
PYDVPGEGLHTEIEKLVGYGIPRPRVMRAATADAWKFLNEMRGAKPQHRGVIEARAVADLLVVAVDPMTTPLPLVPDGVMLRGAWHPKAELDTKLAELRVHVATPEIETPPPGAAIFDELVDSVHVGRAVVRARSAEITDFATNLVATTKLDGDTVDFTAQVRGMSAELHGKRSGATLDMAGTGLSGQTITIPIANPRTGDAALAIGSELAQKLTDSRERVWTPR